MNKILVLILFILVTCTLSTTWIAMKIALKTIPPLFITGIRFLVAFPLLMVISIFFNKPLIFPSGKLLFQVLLCIFYFLLPFTLMLYGGSYINSSLSAILFANVPIIIFLISLIYKNNNKRKLIFFEKIGILLSVLSLIAIFFEKIIFGEFNKIKGISVILLAIISHSIIYVTSKEEFSNLSVLTLNTLPSLFSGIILLMFSYFFEHPNIMNFSIQSWFAVIYLGNIIGVFGILSYFYLQKKINTSFASIVFLLIPFISIEIEYFLHATLPTKIEFFSLILSCVGMLLILFI